MISVGNKIDCIEQSGVSSPAISVADEKMSLISCETSQGFPELIRRIDLAVQSITKSRLRRFRLPPNSKAIPYLYENDLVSSEPVLSECGDFLLFDVVMNDDQFAKFRANTSLKLKRRNQEKETQ
uniref:Uncharacterized protein n=1 Tax=Ditylenchus dipsaci TaxID=166011 RepID=A0A915CKB9_9BILA